MAGGILSWQTIAPAVCKDVQAAKAGAQENTAVQPDPRRLELETLYLIRRPEMIRFLVKFGVDAVEAEDIAQEVFLNAFATPRHQKRPESLFHWALTCAKNLAINRYHHDRKEILAPAERWKRWEKTLTDAKPCADSCLYEKECQLRLARAVSQLNPVEQQCLLLRSRGVSFREIATALQLSMQTAVYTTDVAIKKLQRKLQCVKQ